MLFRAETHGGFYFSDPSGRAASGKGAILLPDGSIPVTHVEHDLDFYEGGRRVRSGTYRLTDAEGTERTYSFTDLGWVYCQGGGYFGGFDDHLGQGVYRGDLHVEGEVWDVTHPTQSWTRPATRSSSTTIGPRASSACARATRPASPTSSAWSSAAGRGTG